ncbi:hypothetical protein PAECIP111802_01329 [Paenibacillus allorhizosphaerae]|uniref:Uncharacterized protein n=2 Tax=Paenibacillus allorhizosphaerae TaxID=2849866 RepID=A0ABN7TI21_9BACL|nr:hypothetical protein PAECIP111802_01329 [Paenibacillus allorhizosphaerae]
MFMLLAFMLTSLWRILAAVLLPAEPLPQFDSRSLWITITVMLVFYSVYFPMFFALGSRMAQILDLIVIFAIGVAGLILLRVLELTHVKVNSLVRILMEADTAALTSWMAGGGCVMLIASWFVAVRLYEHKNV